MSLPGVHRDERYDDMMKWGFYCRTCGVSSTRLYTDPEGPRQDFSALCSGFESGAREGAALSLPPAKMPILDFLAEHCGHELWSECETAVLRLSRGAATEKPAELPGFADSVRVPRTL